MKALITGTNSIVNKVLLRKLVELEYDVTAHYHSNNDLAKEIKSAYPKVNFVQGDFATEGEFAKVFEHLTKAGPYDVIVNAAVTYGTTDEQHNIQEETDWKIWEKALAVNTIVPAMLLAHANKLINVDGVVINISSTMAQPQFGVKEFKVYCATKAALDMLTTTYAKQLAPDVRVVGIAPGYIKSAWNIDMSAQDLKGIVKDNLTQKLVMPEEIADVLELVINNKSMTGNTVVIDGGYSTPII